MKRLAFVVCMLPCLICQVDAQNLYLPRNIRQAYLKATRSPDGRPGKNYWQNTGRYDITVTVMPPNRNITGTERITYFNNSPDTITAPVIRLTLNIHRPGATRLGDADPDYLTSGIHIDRVVANGQKIAWTEPSYHLSWQRFQLPTPLLPHDSLQLTFDWHYQISLKSGREGMIDSTTFFLAYFYPRVAVMDDLDGWDRMDFTDLQEFYNDFNDYTLQVRVPRNFVVWSTGTLANADAVLQAPYAARLKESFTSDSVLPIARSGDMRAGRVTAQRDTNTWRWTAGDITDMACAISDHYEWDASSVVVDENSGRRASVQAAFLDQAQDFHHMVEYGRGALQWFSGNWPGVPYPFPKTTLVQGFADMEYPMMVNDGSNANLDFSRFVAEHELAHSWFPFYMGINETRYGFMDEGWATTFELLISRSNLGRQRADDFYRRFRVEDWISDPSAEQDLPIITPGNILSGAGLGNNEYGKASLGYLAVKDLLGDQLFKKCLHAFMERWHGKHPIPWDFFNTFNEVSGANLTWFWNNWYFSNHYIDLALSHLEKTPTGCRITIQNKGGMAAPVDIVLTYLDGSSQTFHQTPAIWAKNQQQAVISLPLTKKIKEARLSGGIFMDADPDNDKWVSPSPVR